MDGQGQTVGALLRAFPPGSDYPELALISAGRNLARGHLDEVAAHLAVAEAYAETAPPDRQRRLRVAIASLKLALAARRGHLSGVTEQARFLDSPVTGQSDEDIALSNDLRAVALMTLGTVEASVGLADAERHLEEGAILARDVGRPYLEVRCLAQLGFAAKIRSFATTQRRCREAIALAERHGWGAEWYMAPALIALAGTMAWTGDFDEAGRWLQRAEQVLHADTGLAAVDGERASSGEIRNALAVICLAEGDPARALGALRDVLDGTAPVLGYVTVVEAQLLAGLAHRQLGDQRAANQAVERALALAEPDRLVLPFAMTGSRELLEVLPRHETAHAALLADILDVLHGSSATPQEHPAPLAEELSAGELKVLRYLPTNLTRPDIAAELSLSPNTVGTHIRNIYAKLQVRDRSSAVHRARELRLLSAGRTH